MIPCIFLSFFKSRFSVNSFLPVKVLHFKTLFFSFRQKKMKNFLKEKNKKNFKHRREKVEQDSFCLFVLPLLLPFFVFLTFFYLDVLRIKKELKSSKKRKLKKNTANRGFK